MPSNRLKLLNGKIGKDWIDLTKNLFKARCKETFINAPLVHWQDYIVEIPVFRVNAYF